MPADLSINDDIDWVLNCVVLPGEEDTLDIMGFTLTDRFWRGYSHKSVEHNGLSTYVDMDLMLIEDKVEVSTYTSTMPCAYNMTSIMVESDRASLLSISAVCLLNKIKNDRLRKCLHRD